MGEGLECWEDKKPIVGTPGVPACPPDTESCNTVAKALYLAAPQPCVSKSIPQVWAGGFIFHRPHQPSDMLLLFAPCRSPTQKPKSAFPVGSQVLWSDSLGLSVGFHLSWDGTWPCCLSDLLPFLSLESFCISHSDVLALLEPARNVSSSVWLWTCIFPGNSQVNTPRLPSLIALLKLEALFSKAPGFSFLLYFST